MSKKPNKMTGPAAGRTDIAEGNGNGPDASGLISADEIATRAYEIYEREGRVDGRDQDHWLQAQKELLSEQQGGPGGGQPGSQASQPTSSRSARQMASNLPDTMAGAAASN